MQGRAFLLMGTNEMRDPLWSHLPSQARDVADWAKREHTESVSDAMYPRPKPKPSDPYRDALLKNLREANAAIDARLQREGRR